jgi:hypothetical protein
MFTGVIPGFDSFNRWDADDVCPDPVGVISRAYISVNIGIETAHGYIL